MNKIRVAVAGSGGRMGRTLVQAVSQAEGLELCQATERPKSPLLGLDAGELAGVGKLGVVIKPALIVSPDTCDVLIDFTSPTASLSHLTVCQQAGWSLVLGSTGFDAAGRAVISAASQDIGIVFAPNMSVGVNLCFKLLDITARVLGEEVDIEIIEAHHRHKVDAPSGTALRMGEVIAAALGRDLAEVADKLGVSLAEVEDVLVLLQSFEPSGICARNLAECLSIQLKERNHHDPAIAALLEHLDLLARRDLSALRRICHVDDEDLRDMIAEIRELNPKPGLAFGSVAVQPVVPDVYVRQAADGSFLVELNSNTLPRILLNQSYHARVSKDAANPSDKNYLAQQLQSATWLIRALDQRARTILKVASEIVKQQQGFFIHGVRHLRPLTLKAVADAISMHESTVSRVTANKYMATDRGIFELKYFFTSAIAAADGGEAHSAEAVRDRIRALIDAETANDILSDDTIVDKLRASGIDIARRTVAKYRESMRIASSVQRRRDKRNAAASEMLQNA